MANLNLYNLRATIKNVLDKNSATGTTYFISNGLYKKVSDIVAGYHVSKPVPNILYPRIWVELKNTSYDWKNIGRSSLRAGVLNFDIVGIVDTGYGFNDGREESDNQLIKLSDNVEYCLRNYVDLSQPSYVMQALVTSGEYAVEEYNDTYNSIFKLNLEVKTMAT